MPPRVTLQALIRPVPRLLVEQLRPTPRSHSLRIPSSARALSRLSRAPSLCFRCSIQSQLRRQSTSSQPPEPPKEAQNEAIPLGPPPPSEPASSEPASSPSEPTSSEPEPNPDPETSQPQDDTKQQDAVPEQEPNHHLPSYRESARSHLQARISNTMDRLQTRLLTASQTLNDITGYSSIESIKLANAHLEAEVPLAQQRLKAARHNYKSLTNHRASTQREVTTLLARKDTWSPTDLERFTTLYRSDHELEAKVAEAAAELTEAESEESRLGAQLNAGILRRYHEEQIWSDRIRRASTWGTWGLMGFNLVLFIVLQFVAEPWKRQRLVKGFAEAESGVWEEVRREVGEVRGLLLEVKEGRAAAASSAVAEEAGISSAATTAEVEAEENEAAAAAAEVEMVLPAEGEKAAEVEVGEPVVGVAEMEIPVLDDPVVFSWGSNWEEWKEDLMDPVWWKMLLDTRRWRVVLEDLYSERRIDLRMRDASIIALEGAATGAAIAAGVAFLLLQR